MILKINGYPITTRFMEVDPVHITPHKGIDIGTPIGVPIEAPGHGVITAVTNEGAKSFGKAVYLKLDNGTQVIYGHLSQQNVHIGQTVNAGEILGLTGNTGDSTGPHLHVQMIKNGTILDPTPVIHPTDDGSLFQRFLDNGHVDAVAHGGNVWIWIWKKLVDLVVSLYDTLEYLARTGRLDVFMMVTIITGIMLWMVGMKWQVKYVVWAFLGYLVLRGALT